jgi:hypothetical protein
VCGNCAWPCTGGANCLPSVQPEVSALTLPPESSGDVTLTVHATSGTGLPCSVDFEASEPWMSLEVTQIDRESWEIAVSVNSTGLGAGNFTGWVRSTTRCTACAEIDLTVTGASSVDPSEETERLTSWGQIKHGFRQSAAQRSGA